MITEPLSLPQPRRARTAKPAYPMRVYATEDPRAYECTSESSPDTRYLVELDLECCSCSHWVARLMACPIGHPERMSKHLIHVRDTRLSDVIPMDRATHTSHSLPTSPTRTYADESCHPDAGLTVVDGYVIVGGFPLCASCGTRRVGEVGSECDVYVAAELCL